MLGSQIALQYDVEVAVGDDWALPVFFTADGDPLNISAEDFTHDIYDAAGNVILPLTPAVSTSDRVGAANDVLTVSTLDITLPPSPLYRWVLRTSTLADRGLIGGSFTVRPATAARRATAVQDPVTVNIGGGIELTLNLGAVGATGPAGDGPGGGGAVDSVNAKTGVVVLDPDDLDDTATAHKFATAAQLAAVNALGTASTQPTSAFATAAQGALAATAQQTSEKGQVDGYASLDGAGVVPLGQIPDGIARDSEVTAAVSAAIDALLAGAPAALDTLAELAAAIGDDADFAATVTTALAGKQPLNANLTSIAALTTTSYGRSVLEWVSAAAGRTALELGTAATTAATAYATAAQGELANTATQPDDLAEVATSGAYGDLSGTPTISAFGASLVDDADAATARATLGVYSIAEADAASPAFKEVWNGTGSTIAAGLLVEINGSAGAFSTITVADKDTSVSVAGMTTAAIPAGTVGVIQTVGTGISLNTSGLTAGGPLWLGDSGAFVGTLPSSGAIIRIGVVGVVAPSGGSIILDCPSFDVLAAEVEYDPTTSGLTATRVQAAIDEVVAESVAKATVPVTLTIAISDETTALTTGTGKATFRMPHAMTLTGVRASLTTASSSGIPTFDINEGGATILSTKLTIDANELTSTTAATAAVISDAALADDASITIDIDTAGTGAAGAKITLIGTRAV